MRANSDGTFGFSPDAGIGALLRIASKTTAEVLPLKGKLPVVISYNTTPKENRSVRASSASPRACSGDMYATVPTATPGLVRKASRAVAVGGALSPIASDARRPSDDQLGQTEVQNLGLPARGHEDVGGLEVAMNNALRVSGVQRIHNLTCQIQERPCLDRLSSYAMLERLAFQQLHDDEGLPSVLDAFVDIVDRADVRMIQSRGGACFTPEPLQRLNVLGQLFWEETSGRRGGAGGCRRPCRPLPFRRCRASPGRDNVRLLGRSSPAG